MLLTASRFRPNHGVSADAVESEDVHVRAVIMREARNERPAGSEGWLDWLSERGIPGISGVAETLAPLPRGAG